MDDPADPKWRQNNHQFPDLPPHVQGYVREQLRVPEIHLELLLNTQMSILDFIQTKLPPIHQDTASYSIPGDHAFFRQEDPCNDIQVLAQATIPPRAIVVGLVELSKQHWLDGAESVCIPGESALLPIWSLSFWTEAYLHIQPAHDAWTQAFNWLHRDALLAFSSEVQATLSSLSTISWHGDLLPFSPGRAPFPKTTLSGFLCRRWLSDSEIDLMIHYLEAEVKLALNTRDIHFIDTILGRKIVLAYNADISGTELYDPKGSTFLHRFGSRLSQKSELGGIFHVHESHWVTVVVDIAQEELMYGDSAAMETDIQLLDALRWFFSKHIPNLPANQLDDAILPTPKQDLSKDTWNCGIWSFYSLLHHFHKQHPLPRSNTAEFGDLARITVLRKIIEQQNTKVCPIIFEVNPHNLICCLFQNSALNQACTFNSAKHLPWPTTPPRSQNNDLDLLDALRQLSVSPEKPKIIKKHKIKQETPSILAPIFQISRAPNFKTAINLQKRVGYYNLITLIHTKRFITET